MFKNSVRYNLSFGKSEICNNREVDINIYSCMDKQIMVCFWGLCFQKEKSSKTTLTAQTQT